MHKKILTACALATSVLAADDYWCLNNQFGVVGQYGHMRRSQIRKRRLVVKRDEDKTLLDTKDLVDKMSWESAVHGELLFRRDCDSSLQLSYTYIFPWEGRKTFEAEQGRFSFPFDDINFTEGFFDAEEVDAKYRTSLQDAEANFWLHITPQRVNYFSASWILGIRAFYLDDEFRINFLKQGVTSKYDIDTRNIVVGPQLGAVLEMNPTPWLSWMFQIKGAGFINASRGEVLLLDGPKELKVRDYTRNKVSDAWLIQGMGYLAYNLNSQMSFYVGYMGYLLTGLSLAPEQRDISSKSREFLAVDGQIVVDGFITGLRVEF